MVRGLGTTTVCGVTEPEVLPAAADPAPTPAPVDPLEAVTSQRRHKALRFLFFLAMGTLLLVIGIGWVLDGATKSDEAPVVSGVYDTPDGGSIDLVEFRGQPLVINFFATWCGPCRAELPAFAEVSTEFDGQVQFLGLNVDESDVPAALALLEETGVTYPIGLGEDGTLLEKLGGAVMPVTAFVDEEGRLVLAHNGALERAELTALIEDELVG